MTLMNIFFDLISFSCFIISIHDADDEVRKKVPYFPSPTISSLAIEAIRRLKPTESKNTSILSSPSWMRASTTSPSPQFSFFTRIPALYFISTSFTGWRFRSRSSVQVVKYSVLRAGFPLLSEMPLRVTKLAGISSKKREGLLQSGAPYPLRCSARTR